MPHLEPSYLRYIYDGLEKGELHPDNAAALPEGITGLYEEAFEESKPARERQKLLETFPIWALLKKEVSAQFVAEILEVPSQEIVDFIATYSSWFTSPESGKYQLYHERLKVYLLQKLSEQEIATLHNKLVTRLEQALAEQKQDEFELYSLEFLSLHYFTTAMITGDGTKLLALSYNQKHWQRQLKLSKAFEWTKKGLKEVMTWASKYNDEEVIECGLQMVDLHHQEQNDAPQIVALVADGNINTALKRIEAFGGNDKEGLQRKFILYMLCLMELTLLGSKNKVWTNEAIEKLLKHLDEEIPLWNDNIDWKNIFSDNLLISISYKLNELGFDYLYKISKDLDINKSERIVDSINKNTKNNYGSIKLINNIQNEELRYYALHDFAINMAIKGKIKKSINIAKEIDIELLCYNALGEIAKVLFIKGEIKLGIDIIRSIEDEWHRFNSVNSTISELVQMSRYKDSSIIIQENLRVIDHSEFESEKFNHFKAIIIQLIKHEKLDTLLNYINCIPNNYERSLILIELVLSLKNLSNIHDANIVIKKTIKAARSIENKWDKIIILRQIVDLLVNLEIKKNKKVSIIIDEILQTVKEIQVISWRSSALKEITSELAKYGMIKEAKEIVLEINDVSDSSHAFGNIALNQAKLGNLKDSVEIIKQIKNTSTKDLILKDIAIILSQKNNLNESLKIVKNISNIYLLNEALVEISTQTSKKNKIVEIIQFISIDKFKSIALIKISTKFNKIRPYNYSTDLIEESIKIALSIIDENDKIHSLQEIAKELIKQNKIDKSNEIIELVKPLIKKNLLLYESSLLLARQEDWNLIESFVIRISEPKLQYECLFRVGKIICKKYEIETALNIFNNFSLLDIKRTVLEGFIKSITLKDCTFVNINILLFYSFKNEIPFEKILQQYALNQLFFENLPEEKIQRFNRTLNIQWAIDIKNQLPN